MCFYYAIHKKKTDKLVSSKIVDKKQLEIFSEKFIVSGFTFPSMPVVTAPNKIELLDWGLIPQWVKTEKQASEVKSKTLNAMSESVFEKPSFSFSAKNKRCLVLSSGFFEWLHVKGKTYPHYITLADDSMHCFAGIWSSWTSLETDTTHKTFSILTTHANSLVGAIHSKQRMPVILDYQNALKWITQDWTPETSKGIFSPFPSEVMKAHPVARFALTDFDKLQTAKTIQDYQYPELDGRSDTPRQLSIF